MSVAAGICHGFRMQEQKPCGKLILHKAEGTRQVGRPAIRLLGYLKTMGIRDWRQKSQDWDQWRSVIEEVKVHHEL
jgi:hypothetical protein